MMWRQRWQTLRQGWPALRAAPSPTYCQGALVEGQTGRAQDRCIAERVAGRFCHARPSLALGQPEQQVHLAPAGKCCISSNPPVSSS